MNIITKCISETTPIFSWIVKDSDDKNQTAYKIVVTSIDGEVMWDSGTVNSDKSVCVKYDGVQLKENTKYLWKVTVTTENRSVESEIASFITGLSDFSTLKWITTDKNINSPVIYKEFELKSVYDYSVLNICGLGFFEVYINGRKVSDDLMNPVRTDYDDVQYSNLKYPYNNITRKSVKYLTYEVSDYLKNGTNKIAVWLGNGWYRQNGRTVEGTFDYGNSLKMFFKITNGSEIIESDLNCYCTESPIVYDNIFYGETYDARISAIKQPVFLATPPSGRIEPQLCPSERIIETYIPNLKDGIYDTGKCMTGFVEFFCIGNSGDKVEIYYAEDIKEGELDYTSTVGYEESDEKQIQKDTYILSGNGEETYAPRFVWHAFRYFKIIASHDVEIRNIKAHYVCTAVKPRTTFESSSDLLNKIHEASLNTQMTNTHGCVPMDCPHRERLGYTGDGQLSSLSVMYNFDAHQMYRKWINDIIDAQNLSNGFVPHTAPFNGGGGGHGWGSSVAVVPWNLYMQYGDTEILKKCRPYIKKWIEYLKTRVENGLVTYEEKRSWCLGDWCMPSKYSWSEPHLDEIKIPSELVNTTYYIYCIDIYNEISDILGEETGFLYERELAVNALLFDEKYITGEQGTDIFPLFIGIASDVSEAVEKIIDNNYCFLTGISGTRFTLMVLDKFNRNDIAIKMLLNTQYPSFGNMIKNGATSLWETWEGNGSKNHTAFTSADAWLFYGLAGLKPLGGYKEFTLKPFFADELDSLDVSVECEYGTISLKWKRNGSKIDIEIAVPFNTTAYVDLKGRKLKLNSGIYKEVVK